MNYPLLSRRKSMQFFVDAWRGGCNLRDGDRRTPDTQLVTAENVWWQNGALRTRPGFSARVEQAIEEQNTEISWKFCGEDCMRGERTGRRFLRRLLDRNTGKVTIQVGVLTYDGFILMEGSKTDLADDVFAMLVEYPYTETENVLIFMSGGEIYAQDSTTFAWRDVQNEAYIPCVLVGGTGLKADRLRSGSYKPNYEDINLLTDRFCAKYTTSPTDVAYRLPYHQILVERTVRATLERADGSFSIYVVPEGREDSGYDEDGVRMHVDHMKGDIQFLDRNNAVCTMPQAGENNLVIYASRLRLPHEAARIASMQCTTWFGGLRAGSESRQFLGGSQLNPNRMYWSAQGQPLYYPESNYIAVGNINRAITAFGKQDGQLVVFKEREIYSLSAADGGVFPLVVDGSLGENANKTTDYFPMSLLHASVGCDAPNTVRLCGNRLCWADGRGRVYTLLESSGTYVVRELSDHIAPALKRHPHTTWKNACAAVYEGYYLLAVNYEIYALRIDEKALSRDVFVYDDEEDRPIAWYVWNVPLGYPINFLFGSDEGVCGIVRIREGDRTREQPIYIGEASTDVTYKNSEWSTVPISGTIQTKAYDFDMPIAKKQVLRLRIGMTGSADAHAIVLYFHGGMKQEEPVVLQGEALKDGVLLAPSGARGTHFGVRILCEGTIAIDSMIITYR